MPNFGYQFEVIIYPYGSRIIHELSVEVKDNAADPTTVLVYQIDPAGIQQGPFTPVKVAKGRYQYIRTYRAPGNVASMVGNWETLWVGTGGAEGSSTRVHNIRSTNFNI